MSADSVVTYTSVHSEARSWSIPSEDPYEEAARQLLCGQQGTCFRVVVHDSHRAGGSCTCAVTPPRRDYLLLLDLVCEVEVSYAAAAAETARTH
ncbi:hypothetical protein Tco_0271085 [Tanacetum coccineum]